MLDKYNAVLNGLKRATPDSSEGSILPPLSEKELTAMESQLGHTLPEDYRNFLRYLPTHGDFLLDSVGFQYVEEQGEVEGWVSGFEGNPIRSYLLFSETMSADPFSAECLRGLRLIRNMEGVEEIGWPKELLPVAWDRGLNMICLALSGFRPHAMFWFKSNPNDMGDSVYLVADSFDEFMHMLKKEE